MERGEVPRTSLENVRMILSLSSLQVGNQILLKNNSQWNDFRIVAEYLRWQPDLPTNRWVCGFVFGVSRTYVRQPSSRKSDACLIFLRLLPTLPTTDIDVKRVIQLKINYWHHKIKKESHRRHTFSLRFWYNPKFFLPKIRIISVCTAVRLFLASVISSHDNWNVVHEISIGESLL